MFSPIINDITTTHPNEPQFQHLKKLNPNRDYAYREEFYSIQQEAYPEVHPLRVAGEPNSIFQTVLDYARAQRRWQIVHFDESLYRIEAVATTRLLRFKDDIVIELRKSGHADDLFEIHMRSKSRLGRGDLGANAKRIQDFFSKISKDLRANSGDSEK